MTTDKCKRRRYAEDCKREAVAPVTEYGYSVAELGQEELNATEREELERLRKENRQLRMEKEVLKKPVLTPPRK